MHTDDLLLPLAVAALAAGLACLFLSWRARTAPIERRRYGAAGGWALIALGVVIWAHDVGPDVGAAQAVAVAILLALVGVGAHSLSQPAPRKTPREPARPASAAPPAGRRVSSRLLARLVGSLAAAPALGVALGLVFMRWGPGSEATRLVAMAFAVVLGAAAALVYALASARPGRAAGLLAGGVAVLSLSLLIPGGAA